MYTEHLVIKIIVLFTWSEYLSHGYVQAILIHIVCTCIKSADFTIRHSSYPRKENKPTVVQYSDFSSYLKYRIKRMHVWSEGR